LNIHKNKYINLDIHIIFSLNIGESKQPMGLVMFSDALEHVAKIARILRQPQGNALLLGVFMLSYEYALIILCLYLSIYDYLYLYKC
jgi:hypothetical protein